jgi:hypothetical protein
VKVLLAAAPRARRYARPELISGLEVDLTAEARRTGLVYVEPQVPNGARAEDAMPRLVGRPTKRESRGLQIWEVDVEG